MAELALLARAMTYKFAALDVQMGGAKAGVRGDPADWAGKAALMARFCAEIAPLVDTGRLLTGPDMGTAEEDFTPLREHRASPAAISAVVDGVPFEDLLTGYGVTAGAEAALSDRWGGGWDGRSAAIEGFGKVGGGVAREVTRRGGRVAAVSTVAGCLADPAGLDVERLLALRRAHGDACVLHYGRPTGPPGELFTVVEADVVVPGTRPGAINSRTAAALPASVRVVAPAANVPYTAPGAEVLRQRGIVALPDFVCNAGGVIGYRSASDGRGPGLGPGQDHRPDPGGAAPPFRPARRRLRTRRPVPARLVGRATRSCVRTGGLRPRCRPGTPALMRMALSGADSRYLRAASISRSRCSGALCSRGRLTDEGYADFSGRNGSWCWRACAGAANAAGPPPSR